MRTKENKVMEIINHEYHVSSEVAELLEKAGFGWRYKPFETKIGNTVYNQVALSDELPTLDVAQRWLREVKNTDVYIFPTTNTLRECVYQVGIKTFGRSLWIPGQPSTSQYDTYEEAQEAGIKKALEIILERNEQ